MRKVKCGPVDENVSPYLKRPLRSLARVLANRKAAKDTAAPAGQASLRAEAQPPPSASDGSSSAPD